MALARVLRQGGCRAAVIVVVIAAIASAIALLLNGAAVAEMPASFYQAMSGIGTEETICVRNYDAGASLIESYRDFEHLEKETEIKSRSYNTSKDRSDNTRGNASLEVSINSNVIGKSRIIWQSKELMPDLRGRHERYSIASEELTGVFDIQKYIQLWSNSTLDSGKLNWLPCT